jgi:hypothetical protein
MTVGSMQHAERLTRNNAQLLLVDHQVGLYTGVRDIDILQLKHNVVGLTRAMLALKVPVYRDHDDGEMVGAAHSRTR